MKVRKLYQKYPITGSIIVTFLAVGSMKLINMFMQMLPGGLTRDYLMHGATILAAYLIVRVLGYSRIYRIGDVGKTVIAGLPQILLESVFLAGTVAAVFIGYGAGWRPWPEILLGLLKLFRIGFMEESIFRGVIANMVGIRYGKDLKGIWAAVIVSGLIFGAMHMSNMVSGVGFSSALAQSVIACLVGIYLTAVYFRGGNIWIMMLIHALTDSIGLFNSSFTTMGTTDADAVNAISFRGAAFFLIYLVLALFLLRRSKIPEVMENLRAAAGEE